jgi:ribosome-associated protein
MDKKDKRILDQIAQTLYDKKGFNVLVLDVSTFSTMANTYIIAEGNVERHVKALAKELIDTMTEQGRHLYHMDSASPDWIVLDFGDIVIHLMIPETRDRYALEELWRKATIIDVNIEVPAKKD